MRNHYVPKLILRHFSEDNKVNYVNIKEHTIEIRNIKTTFSNDKYYNDELEKKLCENIEAKFGDILNNKILNTNNTINLTRDEVLLIKKYLLSVIFRKPCSNELMEKNIMHIERNIPVKLNKKHINKENSLMLKTLDFLANDKTLEEVYGQIVKNFNLFSNFNHIYSGYLCFWDIKDTGLEFIITDTAYSYCFNSKFQNGFTKFPYFANNCSSCVTDQMKTQFAMMMTSDADYIIYPISKTRAIVVVNIFYKFFARNSEVYGLLKFNDLTIDKCFGFGDANIISSPEINRSGIYKYNIKKLTKDAVIRNNSLLFNEVDTFFAYHDFNKIKSSIDYYTNYPNVLNDLNFLTK